MWRKEEFQGEVRRRDLVDGEEGWRKYSEGVGEEFGEKLEELEGVYGRAR